MGDNAGRVRELSEEFKTLKEAIVAAEVDGLYTFTLEVFGNIMDTDDVQVHSDITIIVVEGSHIAAVAAGHSILVQNGGRLTLGDGTTANPLIILTSVQVTDGEVDVKDGVMIKSFYYALDLKGTDASAVISGGHIEGNKGALSLENGTQVSKISGGEFFGRQETLYLSGAGTKMDQITGGRFYQVDSVTDLHGHTIYLQNSSEIGEISGGYFEAVRNNAIYMVRGSHIGEISGREFVVTRVASEAEENRNAAVYIEGETVTIHAGSMGSYPYNLQYEVAT